MLTAVFDRADAEGATLYEPALLRGKPVVVGFWCVGDPALKETFRFVATDSARYLAAVQHFASTAPSFQFRSFVEQDMLIDRAGYERLPNAALLGRHGFNDQIRLLVRSGRRVVGWLGAFRKGRRYFDRRDRRRLAPIVAESRRLVLAAHDLDSFRSEPLQGAHLLLDAGGRIEHATDPAVDLLSQRDLRDAFVRAVREADGPEGRDVITSRGIAARIVRLVAQRGDGTRYLVTFELPEPLLLPRDAVLSAAQREVARFAAAGATIEEIARATGRGIGTVRTHLAEAYRRLGVANRVELARALEDAHDASKG